MKKKTLEVPPECIGVKLQAEVVGVKHEYKYAMVTVDVSLPGDGGMLPVTKKLWRGYPSKETEWYANNKAAVSTWREILEIPGSLTDNEFVESAEDLAMLEEVSYSLEVVFEQGSSGRPYMKVLSCTVREKEVSTAPIRKKYKMAMLDLKKAKAEAETLSAMLDNLREERKETTGKVATVADYV